MIQYIELLIFHMTYYFLTFPSYLTIVKRNNDGLVVFNHYYNLWRL